MPTKKKVTTKKVVKPKKPASAKASARQGKKPRLLRQSADSARQGKKPRLLRQSADSARRAKQVKLPKKVISYLEKAGVPHEIINHKTVYTAYDAAQTMGKKVSDIAKSLLVKADKDYYVVILPADQNVDFAKLGKSIGKARGKDVAVVKIPGEKIVQNLLKLKDETVSAFGNAYKLPVIAEKNLSKLTKAVFSSGGFNHAVEMKVRDYLDLEKASIGSFGVKKKR